MITVESQRDRDLLAAFLQWLDLEGYLYESGLAESEMVSMVADFEEERRSG